MSLILFVVAFVGLGIGTLLFAMSGGRGGVSSTLQSQSRGSRRFATVVFVLSLLVLGIGVPAAVIAAEETSNDVPHAGLRNLTDAELHGQELFARRCGLCHTLEASNSVAQVGPNLDQLAPNEKFVLDAIQKGRLERQRPDAGQYLHRRGRGGRGEICRKIRGRFGVVRRLM